MLNGSSGQAWADVGTAFSLSSANPRTGGWHLRHTHTNGGSEIRRVFGAQLAEVFVGFAMYCADLPNAENVPGNATNGIYICSFRDQSNNIQCFLLLGTDGAIEVRQDTTILGRTVPVIGAGAYQHIEVYALAGDSNDGAIEIRVDEVTRLNLTGITTVSSANVEFSQFAFGHQLLGGGSPSYPDIDLADMYANDTTDDGSGCNTFIGDCKSGCLMVNADTAQADFSKSSGSSGYSLIDETPPDDSGYIYTAGTTAESDFGLEDTPSNLTEILTVRPFDRAMKDDAGTATLAPNMKSGSTKGTVTGQPVTTAFAYYDSNVPFDPATGVPWTKSGLDAAKRVVERTA